MCCVKKIKWEKRIGRGYNFWGKVTNMDFEFRSYMIWLLGFNRSSVAAI